MRTPALLLLATISLASSAAAFGTKRAHEELALAAMRRANLQGEIDRHLQTNLGMPSGVDTPLALQLGLDPRVEEDLVTDSSDPEAILTRLNRSASRDDEDENGIPTAFPLAPIAYLRFFDEGCRSAPDFDACFNSLERADVSRLIAIGTYAEDNPNPRSRHHFHDPERAHGPSDNYGLDDSDLLPSRLDAVLADLIAAQSRGGSWLRAIASFFGISSLANFELHGRSAIDRALNTERGGGLASSDHPQNLFALPDAERYLYNALTHPDRDQRENYMALHFIALGHVLHLLQDMGSVAHVRNDFIVDHVLIDHLPDFLGTRSLEDAGDDKRIFPRILAASGSSMLNVPAREILLDGRATALSGFLELHQEALDSTDFDVEDFWDRAPLGTPDDTNPARAGLAERVHNRFLSAGTLSNFALTGGYDLPNLPLWSLGGQVGAGPNAVLAVELPERDLEEGTFTGVVSRYLASPLVPHLARCNYHCFYGVPVGLGYSVIDESVQRDYLELLFPLVIDYGAKFLQHYLAPRIEVVPAGDGGFTFRNLTMLSFQADAAAVEIDYATLDPGEQGDRRRRVQVDCGGGPLVVQPASTPVGRGPVADFVCRMPTGLPEPALDPSDFWVVVRGALGQRGEVGTPAEFDTEIGPKDFVVAFDHVQPEILFQSEGPLSPGETDEASQSDLIAIPADLSRSVSSSKESPTLRNLSSELRPALAQRFNLTSAQLDRLDFISPSAEPGGSRVALAMDLAQAQGSVTESPNDIWILDLTKSPEAEAALTIVPKTKPRLGTLGPRWVAWNRDGVNDDVVFGAADPATVTNDLERHDVATGTSLPPRETNHFPGSLHGGVLAAVPTAVNASDISDIHLVDLGTGIGTHRFELGPPAVEPCGPTGCSVGSSTAPAQEEEPEFSPDGTQVAFISAPVGEAGYTGGALYVADLIRSGDAISGGSLWRIGTMDRAMSPIWSPDGAWIVYSDNVVHDLFAVPAAGGAAIRLTYTGTLTAGNLTWLSPLALPTHP
jgi:hypothetical protein